MLFCIRDFSICVFYETVVIKSASCMGRNIFLFLRERIKKYTKSILCSLIQSNSVFATDLAPSIDSSVISVELGRIRPFNCWHWSPYVCLGFHVDAIGDWLRHLDWGVFFRVVHDASEDDTDEAANDAHPFDCILDFDRTSEEKKMN